MKRILTIQDISCVGQCSLTVALPIISAAQIECSVLPTAVLSTHTGGFSGFTFNDLTEDMPGIIKHFVKEGITFDGFYTGYVGSKKQLQIIIDSITTLKQNNELVVVDPAMADNGKLYYGFEKDFPQYMLSLCKIADIIVPNLTEACFLLNKEYKEHLSENEYKELAIELNKLTNASVVLTGVSLSEDKLGALCLDKNTKEIKIYQNKKIDFMFHGTGDVYASSFFAKLINGSSLYEAMVFACDFTRDACLNTYEDKEKHWYGVHFEKSLNMFNK